MIRLVGAALLAAGGGMIGFQAAGELRRQVRELRHMAAGLARLAGELELNAPPLGQLLAQGAKRSSGTVQTLFQGCAQGLEELDREDFCHLWRRLTAGLSELGWEGQAIVAALGETLGRYEVQRQQEALTVAHRRLEELADRLEQEGRSRGRVYEAVGLSIGAFLVILLL